MKDNRPSRTAEFMALFRALETLQPARRRLFDDPYAASLLSGPLAGAAALARLPLLASLVPWLIDRGWPSTRSSGVVRTRAIDDAVSMAMAEGATQLLLLGAGFDSRAYRLPAPSGHSIVAFEVDHPATQRRKCERLRQHRQHVPDDVRYLEVDFERDDVAQVLQSANFDRRQRTVAVWEGVVSYLTASAVDLNFRMIAHLLAPASRLIFTYVHRGALDGSTTFAEAARWRGWVRLNGEPFLFGFAPDELPDYLSERGFRLLGDESTAEAARRYCPVLGRHESGSELYRIVTAERE